MNKAARIRCEELAYIAKRELSMRQSKIPAFTLGMEEKKLRALVSDWNKTPEKYLSHSEQPLAYPEIKLTPPWIEFTSFLDSNDTARFHCTFQPQWRSGSKIGTIIIPHWNAAPEGYIAATKWIRRLLLPSSTLIYIPEYADGKQYAGGPQYNVLGPDIYKTIKRVQQDVLNIQYAGKWLRKQGCTEVGIWAYSIGSLRGCLASLFAPKLFDFFIWHFACDSFATAVMEGIATQKIATTLKNNISRTDLEYYWSIISPGHYAAILNHLPKATRVVQGKYDPILSPENVALLTAKILRFAPRIEVSTGEFGHSTLGKPLNAIKVLAGNIRFYYFQTGLRFI